MVTRPIRGQKHLGTWTNVETVAHTIASWYLINIANIRYRTASAQKWQFTIAHPYPHPSNISVQLNTSGTFGCQPDEPQSSVVTTTIIINVYGFIVINNVSRVLSTSFLYSVGNNITTATRKMPLKLPFIFHTASVVILSDVLPLKDNLTSQYALQTSRLYSVPHLTVCKLGLICYHQVDN